MLEDLPEDLYFTVFNNDQPSGMTIDYQITLIEKDPSYECNCTCNCTCSPPPSSATISGFTMFTLGVVLVTTIAIVLWKTKSKRTIQKSI